MSDLHERFNPKYNSDLIRVLRLFPLFATMGASTIKPLLTSSHRTTALLSRVVAARYFDGNAGGVDVIELLQLLDAENREAFLAWLRVQ